MTPAPFDTALLDRLMAEAGLDVLLATSKHNVQYLLGGHRAMFFDYMDAMGVSRYLPVFGYVRGAPERSFYVGHRTEANQRDVAPFWVAQSRTDSLGSTDAAEKAAAFLHGAGVPARRVGIEAGFLPHDAAQTLHRLLPGAETVEALPVLERLRLRKTDRELHLLREATDRVLGAMAATCAHVRPGQTKQDVVDTLRREEAARGLTFEYCLITAGTGLNRAPSGQVLREGDILSLDSGGNFHGYIGDVCRMAVLGRPDPELTDLLRAVEDIQRAAFASIRPGEPGGVIYAAAEGLIAASPLRGHLHFLAHGMGLVSHEAPHLTRRGPVPYGDEDAALPLQPGTVLSVETTLRHPSRGFIKLEDTVAVTDTGHEVFGDRLRGWIEAGQGAAGQGGRGILAA